MIFGILPLDKDLRVGNMASITLEPNQTEAHASLPPTSLAPEIRKQYRENNEATNSANPDEANGDSSQIAKETKNEGQERSSKEPSQTKTLHNLRWIDYAIWGAIIASIISLISLAIWHIRKQIKLHSN